MDEKMVAESIPNNNIDDENDKNSDVDMEEDEEDSEEFVELNDKIDELNSALDTIEKKNDDIHAQLLELLRTSQQFRQEIRGITDGEQNKTASDNSK